MINLKLQVEKLDNVRDDTNHSVLAAQKNAERIKSQVKSWQNNAEKISTEARNVMEEYEEKAKARCLIGLCPNVVSRYQLSREACKKQIKIVEALREPEQFRGVSERAVRRAISIPSTVGYVAFDSRLSTLEKIVNTLQDDTKNSVGVYGFGGMGKTTLVKQVASRVAEKGIFDEIVMALVAQTPDLKEIQGQIAKKLYLKLEESTVAERAGSIYGRLKEKKVLVILDDLWKVLDLEKVGIPYGAEHMGCKLLLTSRYQGILSSMGAKSMFHLGALEEKEAWSLFEEKTGDVTKDLSFFNIGKEVAKRCAGLPVLIVTVGASLSTRPNLHAWKDALNQLKKMKNKEMHEYVNSAMEFISYKHLEEPHKRLFLLCGLLGSGVSIANLLKYSWGWGLFDEVGRVEDARSKLHALIFELKASCLLLDGDDEENIKIHDVVRGVAISIARKDLIMFLVGDSDTYFNRWPQDDVLERCTGLVFHASRNPLCLFERLECPSLELFILSGFSGDFSLAVPDTFFERTRILKVLDMSGMTFQTLPPSISFLGNLHTLRLDSCYTLKDISIVGELKKLQVLSLVYSYNIEELPREIGQLSELKLLDLSGCSKLKVIPTGLLKGLSQLEELYMSGSFNEWEAKRYLRGSVTSNVSLAELKSLSNLCSLEIEVPNTQLLSKDLDFENLERFTIIVGDKPVEEIKSEFNKKGISRKFSLQLDTTSINHLQHNVRRLFQKAESLCLQKLKGVKSVIHELDNDGFPELKHLIVDEDYEIQFIVNVKTKQHRAFPALESLHLRNLLKLEKFCNGRLMEDSFCKLKTVEVRNCDSLESLFSFSTAISLPCLQEIKISYCDVLKGIVANKCEEDDNVNANDAVGEKIEFVQLRKLSLECLPQLINFYSGVKMLPKVKEIFPEKEEPNSFMPFLNEVSFPRMEELTFSGISNLKCIWSQYQPEISSLKNLQKLSVEKCGNLKYLFTPAIVTCLVGLRELSIRSCKMMKEIVVKEGGETTANAILFPQLSCLFLDDLPNLTTFYSEVEQIGSNENIGVVIQPLFNVKANFLSLKTLKINKLNNIESIWHNQPNDKDSFCKLEDVEVRKCAKLLKIFPSTMLNKIQSVKRVRIDDCGAIEELFEVKKRLNMKEITNDVTMVSQLSNLWISNLPKLRCAWEKDLLEILSFQNLCQVGVDECHSLKHVFPFVMAQHLHQLAELNIKNCKEVQTIVDDDENKEVVEEIKEQEVSTTFLLPKLTEFYLENLPKVECFYPKKHASEWPLLKLLNVKDCNKIYVVDMLNLSGHEGQNQFEKVSFSRLEELTLYKISNIICLWSKYHPSILSFKNLQKLSVEKCDSLEYLFTPSIIVSFERLQQLKIRSCVMMREIVAKGEGETTMDNAITFPQLSDLYLEDLPSLSTFYSGVGEMYPHGNIHTAIQTLFTGKAKFPALKNLEVKKLGKIKSMWHNQSKEEDSFCKLEVVKVTQCAALLKMFPSNMMRKIQSVKKVEIPDCDALEEVFEAKKRLNVKEITDDVTTASQLRDLHLKFHNLSFENLCEVDVRRCEGLKYIFPAFVARGLHQLEELCVMDCKRVETIVDIDVDVDDENKEVVEEEVSTTFIFPKLFKLHLSELPKVECFYPKKHTLEWPVLKKLDVDGCDKISSLDLLTFSENQEHNQFEMLLSQLKRVTIRSKDIKVMTRQHSQLFIVNLRELTITGFDGDESAAAFPSKFVYGLHNLKELTIEKSSLLEEIFPYEEEEEGQEEIFPSLLPLLPHLKELSLINLRELKYICTQNSPFFPILNQLHYLYLLGCPRLTNLLPTPSLSFKFLRQLIVQDCGGLIYLMRSSTAASLEQLQWLTISGCSMIEEIVAADDSQQDHHHIILFSKLEYLYLLGLPRLTNFCTANNYTFKFPKLRYLRVRECPNMRTFSPGITITPKLGRVLFEDAECWNGDLNTTIQHHFSQMETPTLTAADPTTSEPVAQIHGTPTESATNEIQEIGEESTKQREEGQTSEPREEIRTCVDATKPSAKGKEKIQISEEEVVDSAGNEAEIRSHPYSQTHASGSFRSTMPFYEDGESSLPTEQQGEKSKDSTAAHSDPSSLSPAYEPGEETGAGSLASQDVVASSSLLSLASNHLETSQILHATKEFEDLCEEDVVESAGNEPEEQTNAGSLAPRDVIAFPSQLISPTSNHLETSLSLITEPGTNRRAASSDSHDQILRVTKEYIALLSEFLQIRQTQSLNSMSTEQIQFVVNAFRDLSNFSIELHRPYVEKARERLSIVERKRKISEIELKIAETKAQLEALEENKKALEEENEAIASRMDWDD